jgi:hypothetical protein
MPRPRCARRGSLALITLVAVIAPVFSAQAAEPPASKASEARQPQSSATREAPVPGQPKLICEQVQQMGSHFRRKVCATAEAWEARRRKDADQMQRAADSGAGCGGVGNPC